MDKNDGGNAFPQIWNDRDGCERMDSGMTLRDYFAAAVLNAFWSNPRASIDTTNEKSVKIAYSVADAMLKERAK